MKRPFLSQYGPPGRKSLRVRVRCSRGKECVVNLTGQAQNKPGAKMQSKRIRITPMYPKGINVRMRYTNRLRKMITRSWRRGEALRVRIKAKEQEALHRSITIKVKKP